MRHRHVHQNRNEGFTLIEFLIAIVIISVGLLGLLQAVNNSMSTNLETQFRDEAIRLADDTMSDLKSRPFASIPGNTNNDITVPVRQTSMVYNVVQTVTRPYSTQDTINVQLDVTWTYKGIAHVHSLTSLISNSMR